MIGRLSLFLFGRKPESKMKLKLYLLILLCFNCSGVFAQTPKQIKADLIKSLDEIQKYYYSNFSRPENPNFDSLDDDNERLKNKLVYYAKKYPANFSQILKELGGMCSDDGLLNIFSWDTYSGGTQHQFQSVILYRPKKSKTFQLDSLSELNDTYTNFYDSLYTLKIGNKNYYLVTYFQILDIHGRGEGIKIFSIDNGELNSKARIIKTRSGLTSRLYYEYNQTDTNSDIMGDVTIQYNPKEKTIIFPVINEKGHQTDNVITYKFTGKYFEKVKP